MAKAAMKLVRRPVNANQRFSNSSVSIEAAAPASRMNFRATPAGIKSFEAGLGFKLPKKPGEVASKGKTTAMWLGPDEWLLIDEAKPDQTMVPRLPNKGFSAVDISHRNTAFIISGQGAENTLNAACPRNLSLKAFPKNTCSRTIFGKAEVVLHRIENDSFRMECWRSFAPYVWTYLLDAAKDAEH